MALLTVTGMVQGLEDPGRALVMVELLIPALGGHRASAVTLMQADGSYRFENVDTEEFGCTDEREAIFVRANVATVDGVVAVTGEGKCLGECCGCGGTVVVHVQVPRSSSELAAAPSSTNMASSRIDATSEPDRAATLSYRLGRNGPTVLVTGHTDEEALLLAAIESVVASDAQLTSSNPQLWQR